MAFTKITGPGIHTLTNIVSHNVKSSGIITAVNGNLNGWLAVGSTASFSGNVSIGGTLTYDDVTNVESVGLITAKNGIFIPDDKKLEIGNEAGSGDLSLFYDSTPGESLITHTGPGVFKIEGNSSNNIFIRPKNGENSITAKPNAEVELYYDNQLRFRTSGVGATIRDSAASGSGISNSLDLLNIGNNSGDGSSISFLRSPGNTRAQIIAVKNETSNNETDLVFKTTKNGGTLTESLRILGNTQRVGIGTTIPNAPIHVQSSDNTLGILTSTDDGANLDLSDNDTMSRIRSVDGRLQLYADFGSNVSDSSIRFFVDGANEKVRIDSDGRLLVSRSGLTASKNVGTKTGEIQVAAGGNNAAITLINFENSASSPYLMFGKSRAGSATGNTIVQENDRLGEIAFCGADGNDIDSFGAAIKAWVDGTPGNNDMPGRLVFYTTPDGGQTAQERLVIKNDGKIGIGSTDPSHKLSVLAENADGISLINSTNFGTARVYLEGGRNAGTGVVGQLKFYNRLNSGVTSNLKVNGDGNFTFDQGVGIGLDNPSYKLHVYGGNVRIAQPAGTDCTLDVQEGTTTNPLRLMQTATEARIVNSASQPFNIRAQVGSGSTAHLAFWTRDDERLRITASGNIGIGTETPSGVLHTYVDSGTQRSYFQSSHGHSFIRTLAKSTNENSGLEFYSGSSNIANITGIGTGGLLFEVGGSERARIKSGDFAGITANGSFYHEEAGQTNGGDTQDKTIEFNRRGVFLMLISYSLGTTTTDINRNVYSLGLFVSRSNGATWVPIQQDLNSSHVGNLTISDGGARGKLRVEKSSGSDNRQCAFRIDVLSSADVRIIVTDT